MAYGTYHRLSNSSDQPSSSLTAEKGKGERYETLENTWQNHAGYRGNFNVNLIDGVEGFTNKVLFIASECQKVIGVEWQKRQMGFFPNVQLAVIRDAGHEMFAENPEASIAAVREYLDAPGA
jgi:pimeloyl-ACP methyl ester carboxylesterase